jgi:hypothetical protein
VNFDGFFGQNSDFKMGRNDFHGPGKQAAAPSHRRACTGVCTFFAVSVAWTKQVSTAPVHVKVQ